ncbi:MAG: hypothetical protein OXF68_05740 [Gammaproteobacteria bacterium]|nr:hypothetical protein [Gammaproteobacteria bacterium]
MSDPLEPALAQLAERLAETVARRYRIGADQARGCIEGAWRGHEALRALARKNPSARALARTRLYRRAASQAKKDIYYRLRRYRQDADEFSEALERLRGAASGAPCQAAREALARTHASTAERWPDLADFLERTRPVWGDCATLLDVGCGLMPLLFPFDRVGGRFRRYLACDRDARCVEAVNACPQTPPGLLEGCVWDIGDGWAALESQTGIKRYDAAFLLKLVPVVARQQPGLLATLADAPADWLIVTGSRQALTRRRDISRRERSTLGSFAKRHGLVVESEFETASELGLVLRRSGL